MNWAWPKMMLFARENVRKKQSLPVCYGSQGEGVERGLVWISPVLVTAGKPEAPANRKGATPHLPSVGRPYQFP